MDEGFIVSGPQCPATAVSLRPDLALCFWEPMPRTPQRIDICFDEPVLRFSFVVQGRSRSTADGQKDFLRDQGTVEVRYFPACGGAYALEPPPGRWVDVVLRPDFLRIALDGRTERLPSPLRAVVEGKSNAMPCSGGEMTPDQFVAAGQLANCPYNDAARIMFLKSKTLELLSHVLAPRSGSAGACGLSSYQVECLNKARNILIRNLDSPPTLRDLARRVGLNETKLKSGFKALFGQTVYGYYRTYRMDHARRLLMESDASVSQVAAAIGYTNISHFSAAFKTHHGVKPSALRKGRPFQYPQHLPHVPG